MFMSFEITLINKCCNGLSDLIKNPKSRISQDVAICSDNEGTDRLISGFVFAYAKSGFSHDVTHIMGLS